MSCAGCKAILKDNKYLQCALCSQIYDLQCANVSPKEFTHINKDQNIWNCHECRSKIPKCDNSNTPVRTTSVLVSEDVEVLSNVVQQTRKESPPNIDKHARGNRCNCISSQTIREIFKTELKLTMKQLRKENNTQHQQMNKLIGEFEKSLSYFNEEFEKFKSLCVTQKTEIENLRKENESLKTANQETTNKVRMLDQLMRSTNLEVQCVPENKSENIMTTLQQLGNIIDCPVQETEIQYCARSAKLDSSNPRPRSILAKFSSQRIRDKFLNAAIQYNKNNPTDKLNTSHLGIGAEKKSPIFVVEHLTAENKQLHAATRHKARELGYKFVWVRNGRIFVKKSEDSGYVYIRDANALAQLI